MARPKSPPPPSVARPPTLLPWRPAIIVAVTVATYWNSLSIPFLLDDLASIVDNPQIRQWPGASALLFTLPNTTVAGRPVVLLSLAFNYTLGGLDVHGYHIFNLVVHCACALLLFGIVRRTLERPMAESPAAARSTEFANIALAAALIWAVHPLNSEVIDYVSQRTESLMAVFYLLTLYSAIRSLRSSHSSRWQGMAAVACVLGLLSKESMVTAPLVVVLYERIFAFSSFRAAWAARGRFYGMLAATWLAFGVVALTAPRAEVVGFSSGISPWTYLLNQTVLIVHYLRLAVWPHGLIAFYGWAEPFGIAAVWPQAIVLLASFVLVVVGLLRRSRLAFLGAWFFVTLAPASSIVPISTEVGAERRMYLPLAAIVILIVLGTAWTWRRVMTSASSRTARLAGFGATAAVTIALAAATTVRNAEYASPLTLARTIVERRPTGIAHHILGQQLALAGNHAAAVAELREAALSDSKARYGLGLQLYAEEDWTGAIDELGQFLRTSGLSYRLVPHWLEPTTSEIVNARTVMGRAELRLERWPEVIEQARQILVVDRSIPEAYGLLADALFSQGRFNEAADGYRQYLTLSPNDADALTRLGASLMQTSHPAEGLSAFQRAVAVDPQNGEARRNLATALFDNRDLAGAAVQAKAAVALRPTDAGAYALYGRVLGALGRSEEAVEELERALQLDPSDADTRADLARLSSSGSSGRPKS